MSIPQSWLIPSITPQRFPKLKLLPPELREIIYSKMKLEERASMARSSSEAEYYFRKYPINVKMLYVYANNKKGPPSIRVNFDNVYEEQYTLDARMYEKLRNEFALLDTCDCKWCSEELQRGYPRRWEPEFVAGATEREMSWSLWQDIFATVFLTDPVNVCIRTTPYGGLIDGFQPEAILVGKQAKKRVVLVWWHSDSTVEPTEKFAVDKWDRWIEFTSATTLLFVCPTQRSFIHPHIFALTSAQQAINIYAHGHTTITRDQLRLLRGSKLSLTSVGVSEEEWREYYVEKIKQWIDTNSCGHFVLTRDGRCWETPSQLCVVKITSEYFAQNPLPTHFETIYTPGIGHTIEIRNHKEDSLMNVLDNGIYCRQRRSFDKWTNA